MKDFPEWVLKYKKKGVELRKIRGLYYMYEVSSSWDKDLKRPKKKTGVYLGRITEEKGFIAKKPSVAVSNKDSDMAKIHVKERGVSEFIKNNFSEYEELLRSHFPDEWQSILALVFGRFTEHSSMKNMKFHYEHSYLSELYPNARISKNKITELLKKIGNNRFGIVEFFKNFNKEKDNIIFDGTDLTSNSKKMHFPKLSKTKKGGFDFVINIMFIFSVKSQLPIYYRNLQGSIKDMKSFKLSLLESGISDATIILDKGFYSEENIKELESKKLNYLISLKRNNKLINYDAFENNIKEKLDGYFLYEGRVIWYKSEDTEKGRVHIFMNEDLKTEESNDYIKRIDTHPEKYSIKLFHEKVKKFGTLAILENSIHSAEKSYHSYKTRNQVELMIDAFKNLIEADHSYMQNDASLEGWMFINYVALHWYYVILNKLKASKLNEKYSPNDIIKFLKEVKKVKLNNEWYDAEITKKTKDVLDKLGVN